MYFDMDLTEAFYWVCSSDITFSSHNGQDVCLINLKSKEDNDSRLLRIVREDRLFRIGEIIDHEENEAQEVSYEELRHPSLIKQDYKIPSTVPMDKYFLGPVRELHMLSIIHLMQATISHDDEMRVQMITDLELQYPLDGQHETKPNVGEDNVISLFGARNKVLGLG